MKYDIEHKSGRVVTVEADSDEEALSKAQTAFEEMAERYRDKSPPNQVLDAITGLIGGTVRGAEGAAGIPGSLGDLAEAGYQQFLGLSPEESQTGLGQLPNVEEVINFIEGYTGETPRPETRLGRYTESIGEMVAPGASKNPLKWLASTIGGGVGAEAGSEAYGPWGGLLGGLPGLMAPGLISHLMRPGEAASLLSKLNISPEQLVIAARQGDLPADISESAAVLTGEALHGQGPGIEASRRRFTDRPIRKPVEESIAQEIDPAHRSIDEMDVTMDRQFNAFRSGPNIKRDKKLDRLLNTKLVKGSVDFANAPLTPYEKRLQNNKTTIAPKFLESVRQNLIERKKTAVYPQKKDQLEAAADKLVKIVGHPDWAAGQSQSKLSRKAIAGKERVPEVMDPMTSDEDLVKQLTSIIGKAPSPGAVANIRRMQNRDRTAKAARGSKPTLDVEDTGSPLKDAAIAVAAKATGHDLAANSAVLRILKNFARTGSISNEKTAEKIIEAMSDPNSKMWKRAQSVSNRSTPTSLLSALARMGITAGMNEEEILSGGKQ